MEKMGNENWRESDNVRKNENKKQQYQSIEQNHSLNSIPEIIHIYIVVIYLLFSVFVLVRRNKR